MIQSRCLREISLKGTRLSNSLSSPTGPLPTARRKPTLPQLTKTRWRPGIVGASALLHPCSKRFSSSTPGAPGSTSGSSLNTPIADVQPEYAAIAPLPTPDNDYNPTDIFDAFDTSPNDSLQVAEKIGFLRELGLDYGWGPTSSIQWLLEHVYIHSGLPWAGAIIITVAGVRLGMLRWYMKANSTGAKLKELKPAMEPLVAKIKEARAKQDRAAMMKASQERYAMHSAAGISYWSLAVPLLQLPLGFGTFRLLRGMGNLPVPGFDTGGILWFQDLTMPDPYGILIISTSLMYFFSFKAMAASGEMNASPAAILIFRWFIPIVTGIFGLFFPACLQLTLFTTAFFTVSQSYLFRQPMFRRTFGMYPIPQPSEPPKATMNVKAKRKGEVELLQQKPKWGLAAVKDTFRAAFEDMSKKKEELEAQFGTQKETDSGRRSAAEKRRAKAYEEQRQRELAKHKFEASQRTKRRSKP